MSSVVTSGTFVIRNGVIETQDVRDGMALVAKCKKDTPVVKKPNPKRSLPE